MAKDELASAKIELISKLLSSELLEGNGSEDKPKASKKSKRAGTPVSKDAKTRAKREQAGQAELRKAMKKPRSEELGGKK